MLGALAAQEPGAGTPPPVEHTPPPAETTTARTLVLQNLAPFPRREGAAVVVPFAQGAVTGVPDLHVVDTPTAWQPFGARWPDGSVRQALCLFTTQIGLFMLGTAGVLMVLGILWMRKIVDIDV